MATWMQFSRDTEAPGRFFPNGSRVLVTPLGTSALVHPDAGSHALICVVPIDHLTPLRRFRIQIVNRAVGLLFEQVLCGPSREELLNRLASDAPDCEIIDVLEVHGTFT